MFFFFFLSRREATALPRREKEWDRDFKSSQESYNIYRKSPGNSKKEMMKRTRHEVLHIDGLLLFTFTAQANGGAGEEDGRDEGETHSDPGNHVRPVVNTMAKNHFSDEFQSAKALTSRSRFWRHPSGPEQRKRNGFTLVGTVQWSSRFHTRGHGKYIEHIRRIGKNGTHKQKKKKPDQSWLWDLG